MDILLLPELASEQMIPLLQLIVYRDHNDTVENYQSKNCYIEYANIVKRGNQFFVGAGKPVTEEVIKQIALLSAPEMKKLLYPRAMLAENIIYMDQRIGSEILMWYEPAKKRTIQLNNKKGKRFTTIFPAILYCLKNRELSVYALDNNKRPVMKSKLYHYPTFNTYANHTVCMGTVKTKSGRHYEYFEEIMKSYTDGFWQSYFTGNHGSYKKLETLWRSKSIKVSDLIASKQYPTIQHILKLKDDEEEDDSFLDEEEEDDDQT